jgi:hypothetical protein
LRRSRPRCFAAGTLHDHTPRPMHQDRTCDTGGPSRVHPPGPTRDRPTSDPSARIVPRPARSPDGWARTAGRGSDIRAFRRRRPAQGARIPQSTSTISGCPICLT